MQAKQTTMALLICSLFVSGGVLAGGGHGHGGHQSPGYDVDIDDSFNDKTLNYSDDDTLNYSDDDTLNYSDDDTYTKNYTKNTSDFDWSNDQDWSLDVDIDTDINLMVAKSKIKGKLENVSVRYSSGGSMSKPNHHRGGSRGGNDCCGGLTVNNTNSLDGFQGAAGITSVAQNVGGNALAQQSVSINAK